MNRYSLDFPDVLDAWRERYDWIYLVIHVIEPRLWFPSGCVVVCSKLRQGVQWSWDLEEERHPYQVFTLEGFQDFLTYEERPEAYLDVVRGQFEDFRPHLDPKRIRHAIIRELKKSIRSTWSRVFSWNRWKLSIAQRLGVSKRI